MTTSPGFFARRWRGQVPLRTVFWRDMLAVGTAVNVLVTFVALIAASQGAPTWAAVAIHFAPMPYNLFLLVAVARAAPTNRLASGVGLAWVAVMVLV